MHLVLTADGGYVRENGRASVSDAPGLGIEVRLQALGDAMAVYS